MQSHGKEQGNADPTAPALPLLHGPVPLSLLEAQTGILAHVATGECGAQTAFPTPKATGVPLSPAPGTCWVLGCKFWGAQSSFLSLKSAEKEEGFTPQTQPCFTKLKHGWGGCESCKLLSHLVFQIPLSSDPLSDAKLAGQIVFFFQRGMDLNRLIRV